MKPKTGEEYAYCKICKRQRKVRKELTSSKYIYSRWCSECGMQIILGQPFGPPKKSS